MPKQRIQGTYTLTRKTRLYTNYKEFLKMTQKIYNETILKYYNLLFEHLDFLTLSNQNCLRELEKITIPDKNGKKPENYLDLDVPVYLRRAAINHAIGSARAYITKLNNYDEKLNKNLEIKKENRIQDKTAKQEKIIKPEKAKHFNASIVFYKGMYKKITGNSIKIKLFNRK